MKITKRGWVGLAGAGLLLLQTGCASLSGDDPSSAQTDQAARISPRAIARYTVATHRPVRSRRPRRPRTAVIHTGRYRTVSLDPSQGQRDLMQQIVSIDIPDAVDASVSDGMDHVLARSGLSLCADNAGGSQFDTPLPAVDRHVGPTTLRRALRVLAGPAWRLHTNYVKRTVCFSRRSHHTQQTAGQRPSGGGAHA